LISENFLDDFLNGLDDSFMSTPIDLGKKWTPLPLNPYTAVL